MNRLWVRLSIAFGALVVFSVVAVLGIAALLARATSMQALVIEAIQLPGGLMDQLEAYYDTHRSWDGVELFLSGAQSIMASSPVRKMHLWMTDTDGRMIANVRLPDGTSPPDVTTRPALLSVPITTDQTLRGYLKITAINHGESDLQMLFLEWVPGFAVLVGVIGGGGGILFGIAASRYLTAPLNRLAAAAQAIEARDLTRRVEVKGSQETIAVAQAFNNMAAALEHAEKLRRNLMADIAHELRTPLSALQGNLRAILDNVYTLDKGEVARLYDQTRILSRLVNDLHELTLAESQQLHLNMQRVHLASVVRNVAQTFEPIAEMQGVALDVQMPASLPPITGDAIRLEQVLHNLLANALRYTPDGGTIYICAEVAVAAIKLSVRDTGEGIPPEHLPYVFERFYRADRARSRASGGTGLGLAIVRAIVESHRGSITVTSDGVAGRGTTFTITFPTVR
ncbi:MAG: HAMP domain-containing protein [Anaerolineae bacterium]|nr:HAMP domain-containing protein [Anaerolineae bacterium]